MDEFIHILTSWQHWLFEFISDMVVFVPGYILGRIGLKRHDRLVHDHAKHKQSKSHRPIKGPGSQVLNSSPLEEARIPQRASLKKEG